MKSNTIPINDIDKIGTLKNCLIIDLRSKGEYDKGHIHKAINIPFISDINIDKFISLYIKQVIDSHAVHQVQSQFNERKMHEKKAFIYCERGNISLMIVNRLEKLGYKATSLYGGIVEYRGRLEKL